MLALLQSTGCLSKYKKRKPSIITAIIIAIPYNYCYYYYYCSVPIIIAISITAIVVPSLSLMVYYYYYNYSYHYFLLLFLLLLMLLTLLLLLLLLYSITTCYYCCPVLSIATIIYPNVRPRASFPPRAMHPLVAQRSMFPTFGLTAKQHVLQWGACLGPS